MTNFDSIDNKVPISEYMKCNIIFISACYQMDQTPTRAPARQTAPQETPQNPTFETMQRLERRDVQELSRQNSKLATRVLRLRPPVIDRDAAAVAQAAK